MKTVKRIKQVNRAKRKRNKVTLVLSLVAAIFISIIVSFTYAAPKPTTIPADINVEQFLELNKKYYSNVQAKAVPSYETKNNETQQLVVIADFNAHVQGGEQHIVTCKDKNKDCNNVKNRKLINLDNRKDKEAMYYKKLLKDK
ncbi:hypothetical protein CN918_31985 [Priestia megaterium]|nr:hypothetical protein CN918_31985 [Priestia megaterium]